MLEPFIKIQRANLEVESRVRMVFKGI